MIRILCYSVLLLQAANALSPGQLAYKWRLSSDPEKHSIGFRLKGSQPVATLSGYSATIVTQCALACLKQQLCRSFNFNPTRRICELNGDTHDSYDPESNDLLELDSDEEFTYFTRDALQPEGLPGFKEDVQCKNGGFLRLYVSPEGVLTSRCVCTKDWTSTKCEKAVEAAAWSSWSQWSSCSGSCDTGVRMRTRTCISGGGPGESSTCYGRSRQLEECELKSCVEYRWLSWSPWTSCSSATTCGQGVRTRTRTCVHIPTNETSMSCHGEAKETTPCMAPSCNAPVKLVNSAAFGDGDVIIYDDLLKTWRQVCGDSWGEKEGNVVCKQLGFRTSAAAFPGNITADLDRWQPSVHNFSCHGNEISLASCLHDDWLSDDNGHLCQSMASLRCVVDGGWGSWGEWSNCSTSCGDGVITRIRSCDYPEPRYGGVDCQGNATEMALCTNQPCKVDGVWQQWSEWTTCSATCNNGSRWRHRQCEPPKYGGAQCYGDDHDTEDCFIEHCPVDGVWSEWTDWADCSVTCGNGTRSRHRKCDPPLYGGAPCGGPINETKPCSLDDCTVPANWQSWGLWGSCSVTCGGGIQTRIRQCVGLDGSQVDVKNCDGDSTEQEACHQYDCVPYAKTCSELVIKGLKDSAMVQIDPTQDGNPFWAKCDVVAENGIGVTEITHDRMSRRRVSGYEVAGEFRMDLTYNTSLDNVKSLVDVSASCRQFIEWECLSATIKNPYNPDEAMTFWANRDEENRFYWGGATPESQSCACALNNSCADPEKKCNCDANDQVLREDSGYIEERADLPITIFYAGDTGGNDEMGNITIGPLRCSGTIDDYDGYDNY